VAVHGFRCEASDTPLSNEVAESFATNDVGNVDPFVEIETAMRSQDFDRRHQAMLKLWGDRKTYRSWVEKASADPDAEVARRATWVLDRWRRGVLPETPPEIARQLEASSGPDTVERLLNVGQFRGALVALDEAIGGAASPAILDRAKSAMKRRFPFYVRLASQPEDMESLIAIMDRLATDATMTLSHWQLQRSFRDSDDVELPTAASRWPADERARFGIVLTAAKGQLREATKQAEQSGDAELIRVCRMLNGDWDKMAEEHWAAAKTTEPDSLEWYRQWMYALIAASRADKKAIRDEAVARLAEPRTADKDSDPADPINRARWQTLALHGEIDAAIRILQPEQPNDAAELLAQASRYVDAFAAIDVDWTNVDSQMEQLVRDAIGGERRQLGNTADRSSPELSRLLAAARLLVSTGREDLALSSLKSLVNHPSLANPDETMTMRFELVRFLGRINRDDWIGELLVGVDENGLSNRTNFFLGVALEVEAETVSSMMAALNKIKPGITPSERARDMITLLQGSLPQWFNPESDFEALYEALSNNQKVVREQGTALIKNFPRLNANYVKLFELHEQPELAKGTLQVMANSGDANAILTLADSELNEGSTAVARDLYSSVWKTTDVNGQNVSRINQSEADALIAMKAIYGEALAARRLGDIEGANELNRLIQWMSFTPSLTLRNSFAEYLVQQGLNEQAAAIYRPMMCLTAFGSDDSVEFYAVARNYDAAVSETDPTGASAALDLAIAGTIETTIFYPAAYVSLPSFVHRRAVRNAITKGDQEAVRRETEKLLRLDPIDIDFGEKSLKSMHKAGMDELATEILERIYQAGNKHLDTFPLDVSTSNNLAWILSLSDYRLDEALRLSRQAVHYEPESTIYRDTLAEVLFRLGRSQEAIAVEKACLLDDPAEWHVHEQIRRFQTMNSDGGSSEK